MKRLIFISILMLTGEVVGQQSPQYNQYMFNGLAINPAYAGVRECLSITGIHSNQWAGFDGAPTTNNITAHTPFKKHSGVGINFFTDKIGVQTQSGLNGVYAYHLKLSTKSKLSFGISGGMSVFTNQDQDVVLVDNDKAFSNNSQTYSFPNFGTGLFYYRENFYTGLSIPNLFSSEYSNISQGRYFDINPGAINIMQTAGGIVKLSDNVKWKPSYLIKVIPNGASSIDLNSLLYFNNKLNVGASYRHQKALVAILGCTIKKKLDIGYSFAFPLTDIAMYSFGTHEIMLRYELRETVSSINPRLY